MRLRKNNFMENESCLVLIKPDGLLKSVTGNIINELSTTKLKIIGSKIVSVNNELAEKHYEALKEERPEIFEEVLKYIKGEYHTNRVLALVYYGENACEKIRTVAGSTNPESADPTSVRGRYGRIHSETGVFENCMHASDSPESGEREIKLWFRPCELTEDVYPVKKLKIEKDISEWK